MRNLFLFLLIVAAVATADPQVVNSFAAPAGVTGLAHAQGKLYAVTSSEVLYELDPATGTVLNQFPTTQTTNAPNGLGYAGSLLYVTDGTAYVFKYTVGGVYSGAASVYCPG